MYTHVCIRTAHPTVDNPFPKIKERDFCTLVKTHKTNNVKGGIALEFKEDITTMYAVYLFVELPPQKEKTIYVAVSEEVKKELSEPVLN